MPDLILQVSLSDDEASLYRGRDAMVVPVSAEETAELRQNIIGLHEFLTQLGAVEVAPEATGELADFLRQMIEVARAAAEGQSRTRELLGRAAFVGAGAPGRGKAVLQ